jgi:hypothetical protein
VERYSQLEELAKKISALEKEYSVVILSSNGYTDALIVDELTGRGYNYLRRKGVLSRADD